MKNFNLEKIFFPAILLIATTLNAQNVAINTTGNTAYASAILDLSNQNTIGAVGFLPPYVTLTSLTTFGLSGAAAQSNGLIVYNSGGSIPNGLYYWDNTDAIWVAWGGVTGVSWLLTGNGGTTPGTNFIGTTDNEDVIFKQNNVQSGLLDNVLNNTSWGVGALNSGAIGNNNTAVGFQALNSNTTAGNNTATGYQALFSNTTGDSNTAVGSLALTSNTKGTKNTATGYQALQNNITGNFNTASGFEALQSNTGSQNTATGYQALQSNTFASANTALGYQTLHSNVSGSQNTASGTSALQNNTTGSFNTASGYEALESNNTGTQNTASGTSALQNNTTGSFNTASGISALQNNTTGAQNTASGGSSLLGNTSGTQNTASGNASLLRNTTGGSNAAFGYLALQTNTTGTQNTAIGCNADVAGNNLTNATAIGYNANVGTSNTITLGNNSVTATEFNGALMPYYSAAYNAGITGQVLTSKGAGVAPQWTTIVAGGGSYVKDSVSFYDWLLKGNAGTTPGPNFIGTTDAEALEFKVNSQKAGWIDYDGTKANAFFGYQAGIINTGNFNAALGAEALFSNTTGGENTASGFQALFSNTAGIANTALGCEALLNNITGSENTAIGYSANVASTNLINSTAIGYSATVATSNTITLGNNSVTATEFNGALMPYYSATYNAGTTGQVLTSKGAGSAPQWTSGSSYVKDSVPFYDWLLTGNTGTIPGTNFMGTTDAEALEFKVNSQQAGWLDYDGTKANAFFGYQAGIINTGNFNAAFGYMALGTNTTGTQNTAIGYNANVASNNLTNTTAIGYNAMVATSNTITLGNNSVTATEFNGALMPYYGAAYNAGTVGQVLTSQGAGSAPQWTPAQSLVKSYVKDSVSFYDWLLTGNAGTTPGTNFIGTTDAQALEFKVKNQKAGWIDYDGTKANAFFGYQAGNSNTSIDNAAFGYMALASNTSGAFNTALGFQALSLNNVGSENTATGYDALSNNLNGKANTANGSSALQLNSTGSYNTAMGRQALASNSTAGHNAAFGNSTLSSNSTGTENTAMGDSALTANSTTGNNTAVGHSALHSNTVGDSNTAVGSFALSHNTTGTRNSAIGYNANVGSNNLTNATAIGYNATVNESNALILGNGVNVGIGTSTPAYQLDNSNGFFHTTFNEAANSLPPVTNSGGLAIGWNYTGGQAEVDMQNVYVNGAAFAPTSFQFSQMTSATTENQLLTINSNAYTGFGTTIVPYPITMIGGAYCTGTTWVNVSSRKLKENIVDINKDTLLAKLDRLPILEWNYIKTANNTEGAKVKHIGPLAEDFYAAFNVGVDSVSISTIDPAGIALGAIQALNKKVKCQQAIIDTLGKEVIELKQQTTTNTQQTSIDELKTEVEILKQQMAAMSANTKQTATIQK